METVTVDAKALRQVLQALIGPSHHIAEMQATRGLHALTGDNPIELLVEQYAAAVDKHNAAQQGGPDA